MFFIFALYDQISLRKGKTLPHALADACHGSWCSAQVGLQPWICWPLTRPLSCATTSKPYTGMVVELLLSWLTRGASVVDLLVINMTFVIRRNAQTSRWEGVSFFVYFDSFSSYRG